MTVARPRLHLLHHLLDRNHSFVSCGFLWNLAKIFRSDLFVLIISLKPASAAPSARSTSSAPRGAGSRPGGGRE